MPVEHASDAATTQPARKVRIRRGMFRLWILFSIPWTLCFLGLSAADLYQRQVSLYNRGLQIRVTETACPENTATGKALATLYSCFNVSGPGKAKYLIVDKANTPPASIATVVKYDDRYFDFKDEACGGCAPFFIDLTDEKWTEKWLATDVSRTSDSGLFTTLALAFAVPAGLLALGAAIGWAATGFRP